MPTTARWWIGRGRSRRFRRCTDWIGGCVAGLYNIASHMKTTIEIPDRLLGEARAMATHQNTTMKALVEEALRRFIAQNNRTGSFKLRKAGFRGRGLHPEAEDGSWARIRHLIYEGRGA